MSPFDPFPTLRTERLVLRRIEPDDVEVVFRLHSDPAVMRYLARPAFPSREPAVRWIAEEAASRARGEAIRWGIALGEGGPLVGTAGFWRWNTAHQLAEIGYDLLPEQWGRGLVPEALRPIFSWGFAHMGLHRVEANIDPANTGSARVLEKLGFVLEGHLRENWFFDGTFTDTGTYGLLAADFARLVAPDLRASPGA